MSWIQDNKGPAAILGLTGVGVIGLGVMLFNAWSGATSAQEEFDLVNTSLARLKSSPLAPTPENLEQKQKLVKAYVDEVGKLSLVLYKLQPEDKPTTNTEFQAKLKARIAEIRKLAGNKLPADFNLAFDQYTSELPKSDQVAAQLSTYLDSVEEIVKLAVKSGVQSILLFERSPLPSEKGEPDKPKQTTTKSKAKGAAVQPSATPPATN
ncbi:MAG: Amuc_1100 family pilus-like protein, partial [Prosthecobacter sp.]|nr:Amuc_1100 family pilus-like protein [Prosthecobacter sp.]